MTVSVRPSSSYSRTLMLSMKMFPVSFFLREKIIAVTIRTILTRIEVRKVLEMLIPPICITYSGLSSMCTMVVVIAYQRRYEVVDLVGGKDHPAKDPREDEERAGVQCAVQPVPDQ